MTRELRAQERVLCAWPSNGECDPRPSFQCDGCAYDGTRWVTVGVLRDCGATVVPAPDTNGYLLEPRYSIEEES